jgi:hypothetical protein
MQRETAIKMPGWLLQDSSSCSASHSLKSSIISHPHFCQTQACDMRYPSVQRTKKKKKKGSQNNIELDTLGGVRVRGGSRENAEDNIIMGTPLSENTIK